MKKAKLNRLLDYGSHEIEKIDVKEDPVGHFSTHIKLITKYKTYFAKKDDDFLYRSFSKAIKAIKAQIGKNRIDHIHSHMSLKNIQ
jgi:hypothetical protein